MGSASRSPPAERRRTRPSVRLHPARQFLRRVPGDERSRTSPHIAVTIQRHARCRMQMVEGFDFFPLTFDDRGKLKTARELTSLIARANSAPASDAIFLAHGFRNDESEATTLYNKFLKTFRAQLS